MRCEIICDRTLENQRQATCAIFGLCETPLVRVMHLVTLTCNQSIETHMARLQFCTGRLCLQSVLSSKRSWGKHNLLIISAMVIMISHLLELFLHFSHLHYPHPLQASHLCTQVMDSMAEMFVSRFMLLAQGIVSRVAWWAAANLRRWPRHGGLGLFEMPHVQAATEHLEILRFMSPWHRKRMS